MSVSHHFARLLTEQFYRWELRGRGWEVHPNRIRLEPPFRPFEGHYIPSSAVEDDGRVESLGGRLARKVFPFLAEAKGTALPEEIEEPVARLQPYLLDLVELQIALPREYQPQPNLFEQFLMSVGHSENSIAFEVVGSKEELVVQVVADRADAENIRSQLKAFFPEAVVTSEEAYLEGKIFQQSGPCFSAMEFGLQKEFVVPINNLKRLPADPLVALCGAMDRLGESELAVFQVLLEPARDPWAASMMNAVTLGDGRPFFLNAPELVDHAREKTSRPLYAVVLRIAAFADSEDRKEKLLEALAGALRPLSHVQGNRLVPLNNQDYEDEDHENDLLERASHRSGMILNSDELIALVHLPTAAVRASDLRRALQKTRKAPELDGTGVILGENLHEGIIREVRLPMQTRLNHCHVLGGAGTGKSTLLSWMAVQDIVQGHGVAVIDPHGDLIETILPHIPPERRDDVILFDPTDEECAIAFNPLAARSDRERELVASDFIAVMKQHTTSWGDQMSSLLGNAVLAFLQSSRGGTLPELRRFLSDPSFRKEFLKTVTNSEVQYFWETEAGFANKSAVGSILTRLDALLRHESVLHILGQKENRLHFGEIMDGKKIFLARLAKGLIGDSNAYILGGLLVARFYQTAIARQKLRQEEREPFMLILDEAGDLLTSTVGEILVGARKYGLGLTLAHQSLRQLSGSDQILGAVTGSCRTKICFQVGGEDARKMAEEFEGFIPADLMSLPTWHAVARVGSRDASFNLKALLLPPPPVDPTDAYHDLLEWTRKRYSTPREVIRKEIESLRVPRAKEDKVDPFAKIEAKRKKEKDEDKELPASAPVSGTPAETPSVEKSALKAESIKNAIIQAAGGWGYSYETEKSILDGKGRVDIVLSLGKLVVACEISATTTPEQEKAHVVNCLEAGYSRILHACDATNKRNKIQALVRAECSHADLQKVRFLTVKQCITHLGELAEEEKRSTPKPEPSGKTVMTTPAIASEAERKEVAESIWEKIQRNKNRDGKKGG